MSGSVELTGPDLEMGVRVAELAGRGTLLGHAGGEPVLIVRRGEEFFAVGATCTHYGGPLAEGMVVGEAVRCPWHHACFDVRTGEASPPAFNSIPCWKIERREDLLFVKGKLPPGRRPRSAPEIPKRVVIVGGGAAGHSAVETFRREGYQGSLTLISADASAPYDRPNASKDYLAGTASEEWMPLRPPEFYSEQRIDLRLAARVAGIDTSARAVRLETGETIAFDALLLATGADPVRLSIPGGELPHVRYLRSLADSRAIVARCGAARRVVVLGASFIGLEVAASLRTRGLEVHVAAPSSPLESVLGPQVSDFVRALHEEHGVVFHIGQTAARIAPDAVALSDGTSLPADLVVAGIGVRPSLALAEQAGLALDRGVAVNEFLETSIPGIYAAGDIARWLDARTGGRPRVEHWVVAQRQGATAARNMLGRREPFTDVPFFWSQHYDVAINYVGHAERWERADLAGSLKDRDGVVVYREAGRIAAVVTIGRDRVSLEAEAAFASDDQAALEALARG